jgi:ankyrin repeat protein
MKSEHLKTILFLIAYILTSLYAIAQKTGIDSIKSISVTEVFAAAKNGELDIVKKYIEGRNDIQVIYEEMTLLMTANNYDKFEISKYLIKNGANLHAKTDRGTPLLSLDYARYLFNNPEQVKMLDYMILKILSPISLKNKGTQLPTSTSIKNKITKEVRKQMNLADAQIVMQLYDINIDDVQKAKFSVKCDIGAIDPTGTNMADYCCWSGYTMPQPKTIKNHLAALGPNGPAPEFTFPPSRTHWIFVFNLNKENNWIVQLAASQ